MRVAGDEQEKVLGMQMMDAKEQEQEFIVQLKLDGFPSIRSGPKTRMVGTSERDSSLHSSFAHNDWSQGEGSHGSDHEGSRQSRDHRRSRAFSVWSLPRNAICCVGHGSVCVQLHSRGHLDDQNVTGVA